MKLRQVSPGAGQTAPGLIYPAHNGASLLQRELSSPVFMFVQNIAFNAKQIVKILLIDSYFPNILIFLD